MAFLKDLVKQFDTSNDLREKLKVAKATGDTPSLDALRIPTEPKVLH